MYSVKNGNRFQLAVMTYFIFGNIIFGILVALFTNNESIVLNAFVSQVVFVGGSVLIYKLISGGTWKHDFYIKGLNWLDMLIAVGIAWTLMPILSLINVLSQFVVTNQVQDALLEIANLPFLATVVLTGIFPAVFEELLSRSVILRNYQKKTVLVACLASGMFFGFIHLNLNQFLYAFVMGAVMCYLVMVTGSVLTSMIIHFTINTTSTAFLYISLAFMKMFEGNEDLMGDWMSTAQPTATELAITSVVMLFVALMFAPVAVLLIRLLLKRHNKTFRGSLRLYTEDFMAEGQLSEVESSFDEVLGEAEENTGTVDQTTAPEEKVWTVPLMITAFLFISFSLLIELAMNQG